MIFAVPVTDEGACVAVQDSSSRRAIRPDTGGFLGEGLQVGLGFTAAERRWHAGRERSANLQVKHDRGNLRPRRDMHWRDQLGRRRDARRATRRQAHRPPVGDSA